MVDNRPEAEMATPALWASRSFLRLAHDRAVQVWDTLRVVEAFTGLDLAPASWAPARVQRHIYDGMTGGVTDIESHVLLPVPDKELIPATTFRTRAFDSVRHLSRSFRPVVLPVATGVVGLFEQVPGFFGSFRRPQTGQPCVIAEMARDMLQCPKGIARPVWRAK